MAKEGGSHAKKTGNGMECSCVGTTRCKDILREPAGHIRSRVKMRAYARTQTRTHIYIYVYTHCTSKSVLACESEYVYGSNM